jgi:hypothetical protein
MICRRKFVEESTPEALPLMGQMRIAQCELPLGTSHVSGVLYLHQCCGVCASISSVCHLVHYEYVESEQCVRGRSGSRSYSGRAGRYSEQIMSTCILSPSLPDIWGVRSPYSIQSLLKALVIMTFT